MLQIYWNRSDTPQWVYLSIPQVQTNWTELKCSLSTFQLLTTLPERWRYSNITPVSAVLHRRISGSWQMKNLACPQFSSASNRLARPGNGPAPKNNCNEKKSTMPATNKSTISQHNIVGISDCATGDVHNACLLHIIFSRGIRALCIKQWSLIQRDIGIYGDMNYKK